MASRVSREPGLHRRALVAFFVASGAAGLIYQVVWTRELVLLFGNTTEAIVTTVSAFLAGLGLGALIGGAISVRLRRPLRVYGGLEIAVGLLALCMPIAFDEIAVIFPSVYLSLPPTEVVLIRFVLAFLALLPVTLIMGMTLPVLTRHFIRSQPTIGSRIALLYGVNTLGAVIGTLGSGLVLIEILGLHATTLCAVTLNLTVGSWALVLSSRIGGATAEVHPPKATRVRGQLSRIQMLLLAATFVSGFVSLSLEVLWTRLLMQGAGGFVYLFVLVLAIFLLGIGFGSLLFEHWRDFRATPQALALCMAGIGILAVIPVLVSDHSGPPAFGYSLLTMLPATLLMGFAFPLTAALFISDPANAGRGVGLIYFTNTVGSVAGTVITGFLLVPTLGTNSTIAYLGLAETAIACTFLVVSERRFSRVAVSALALATLVFVSQLPVARLTLSQLMFGNSDTVHLEDTIATVDAIGTAPKQLLVGGNGMTGITVDTKLVAYVPTALRPNSKNILVIAFGMGSTYRSALIAGLSADVVELSPSVPKVMWVYYPDASQYLDNPRGNVTINDGRNYVRLSSKKYDLLVVDAPPPSQAAGTVVLLTHEFYDEAKQRLNPGGIMGTFLPADMPLCEVQAHLRTFSQTFAHTMAVVSPGGNGFLLLGSDSPMDFTANNVEKVFGSSGVQADLASSPDFGPLPASQWLPEIESRIWLQDSATVKFAGQGPIITDDRPYTEYFLLRDALDPSCQAGWIPNLGSASATPRALVGMFRDVP